jgi:hypothetical protein
VGLVACVYNPSTQEAETGGAQVLGQPKLHNMTCLKNRTKQNGPELNSFFLTIRPLPFVGK